MVAVVEEFCVGVDDPVGDFGHGGGGVVVIVETVMGYVV